MEHFIDDPLDVVNCKPDFSNMGLQNEVYLVLSTRSDKLGNVFHYVKFKNNDDTFSYARFTKLSSALDFIHSNFK